ncbi:hypothetical protein [uncultured Erythrobacter sp.]|uniref:hypothetical protein n=1 Tax=uncultured Erythrobacter sp. TaxID=263913 RepID=UPI0037486AD5
MPKAASQTTGLWLAYQQIQPASLEKATTKAQYIAAFIVQDPSKATFAGIVEQLSASIPAI